MKTLAFILACTTLTTGQTLMTLHSFCPSADNCTDGTLPWAGLVEGRDGDFYGVTYKGGNLTNDQGAIYKITPAGVMTILYEFGPNQGDSFSRLVQAKDGNFYGTTGAGIVYKITTSGTFTVLHTFANVQIYAALMQASDGDFYGTTEDYIFKMTPAGITTILHTYLPSEGAEAAGTLIEATDGNFYGTTQKGGYTLGPCNPYGCGTIYKMTPLGTLTVLHNFTGGKDGGNPWAGLLQATDGNFYGTTIGTVFKMTPYGDITTLTNTNIDTWAPLIQDTSGTLYGTVGYVAGTGGGSVFKMTTSGKMTNIHYFNGPDGIYPLGGVIFGSNGKLYGTTYEGGEFWNLGINGVYCYNPQHTHYGNNNYGCGTIFELSLK